MSISAMEIVQKVDVDSQAFQEQFMIYFEMILTMEASLLEGYGDVLVLIDTVEGEWNGRELRVLPDRFVLSL